MSDVESNESDESDSRQETLNNEFWLVGELFAIIALLIK